MGAHKPDSGFEGEEPEPIGPPNPPSRSQDMATWPSSSDPSTQQPDAIRKRNKSDQIKFLIPLIYAPVLPLIRITLRKQPVLRDRLFIAVLAGAFAHGTYLVTDLFN